MAFISSLPLSYPGNWLFNMKCLANEAGQRVSVTTEEFSEIDEGFEMKNKYFTSLASSSNTQTRRGKKGLQPEVSEYRAEYELS